MNQVKENSKLEKVIAGLLWYGTWIASAVITAGLILSMLHLSEGLHPLLDGYGLMKAGVALFILLPILRVVLMLFVFLQERDFIFTAISILVLIIIGSGVLISI